MQFNYNIATKVFFGKDCIKKNKQIFSAFGKKALIVTGKRSAKESGALDDVCGVLDEQGIAFEIFDRVENNPSVENVEAGGIQAREAGADFIIGIGGGSPLDASKGIAVLATNSIGPLELFVNKFDVKPLPIIAIPTTAGTGSEITPYSVLTRNDLRTKVSFGNDDTFPRIAFMDAGYTVSLPHDVTVNTAVDAFSHAVEGYINKRSSPVSDIFAVEAIKYFGECIDSLLNNQINYDVREKLLYAAMLGGMVISHTGTTMVHGMGYNLTYFMEIPHGKANGLLMKEYFKYNYEKAGDRVDNILRLINIRNLDEFGKLTEALLGGRPELKPEDVEKFSPIAMQQRSTLNNIRETTESDIAEIYKNAFIL